MENRINEIKEELDMLLACEIQAIREQASTVIIDLKVLSLRKELIDLHNKAWRE